MPRHRAAWRGLAGLGLAGSGMAFACHGSPGLLGDGWATHGWAVWASHGSTGPGIVRLGASWQPGQGLFWRGRVRRGVARQGAAVVVSPGPARLVTARSLRARHGSHGWVRLGAARKACSGAAVMATQGGDVTARRGWSSARQSWRGESGHVSAWQGQVSRGSQGSAWRGLVGHRPSRLGSHGVLSNKQSPLTNNVPTRS